ncbi:MAG: hypothetical protein B7Z33_11530 [Sphingomonadales bacterium 12-68-11]|nr:MAG: hypothetical protein B7Z33_11530 [Sphingomonadales bacterium 12-68-11]
MAEDADLDAVSVPRSRRRRVGCWALFAILLILLAVGVAAWLARERIADNVIAGALRDRGIAATYEIEQIGPRQQILRNIVVGNPARPDLTIERAYVDVVPRLGVPTLGQIRLVRPRLYATVRGGALSFGALDPLIFAESEGAGGLPDLDLAIEDGRALVEGDYGPVGVKLAGQGNLRSGFAGELAATAPRLSLAGCAATAVTLYGQVTTAAGRPRLRGPLRFGRLGCDESGVAVARSTVQLDVRADAALAVFEGQARIGAGAVSWAGNGLAELAGETRFTWRDGGLTARYDLVAERLTTRQASLGRLAFEGMVRAREMFARVELDATLDGRDLTLGPALGDALGQAALAGQGTLLEPILARIRAQLAREAGNSRLAADVTLRHGQGRTALFVPAASLRGGRGATLLSLTRGQYAVVADGAPQIGGDFSTGGEGLPRIAGRVARREDGALQWRLTMAPYTAGESALAVPELVLLQLPGGAIGFSGRVQASGALPGGQAEALVLPVSGNWSQARGLSLWRSCTEVRFARLRYASLSLARHGVTLCPPPGSAIVRYGPEGLSIAAGATALQLAGQLGETPITVRSGPVGFAYPGSVSARQLDVTLGPAETAQRFQISDLAARIGDEVAGTFRGADVRLFSVPLDVLGAAGDWRYADGRLTLSNGAFRLEDRQETDRFEPLMARGASLALVDNVVTAEAVLRHPGTDAAITRTDIRHDLNSGRGHADLAVDGLAFTRRGLQPDQLTDNARGVVSLVEGTVSGTGRIDWDGDSVTSTGRFSSDKLDFAAAFGPVTGASGTVEFTDLLGLVTAPGQAIRIASVNPGLEVLDGELRFALRGPQTVAIEGARWPFLGGTLTMRPVELNFGAPEARRYVFEIEGLEAARFVERMQLDNLSATGVLDGTVPIVFDEAGNGSLEGGLLVSRPPGGNVSYVGELTYEDLSTMANFAFDALRSLDYRQMRIELDGQLAGEIVTKVRLDGVSQGAGTGESFVTRAVTGAIAGLPIRFDVNVRAPFAAVMANVRGLYDPTMIRDPRDLAREGRLIDAQGNVITNPEGVPAPPTPPIPNDALPPEPPIQRRESEDTP